MNCSRTSAKRRRRGRGERGNALVEFAIIAPLFFTILLWSMYFFDILQIRLKVQEAARYAAWEVSAYELSDYIGQDHDGRFATAKTEIEDEATQRYEELNSAIEGDNKDRRYYTVEFDGVTVTLSNEDAPLLASESMADAANNIPGVPAGLGGILGNMSDTVSEVFGAMGFNTKGRALARAEVDVENHLLPRRFLQNFHSEEFFPSGKLGELHFEHEHTVVIDPWAVHDGSDVKGSSKEPTISAPDSPFFVQSQRMCLAGAPGIVPGMDSMLQSINQAQSAMANMGFPTFLSTPLVSINYKGSADSGKDSLNVSGGIHDFHTSPMRDAPQYDQSLYYQVFNQRGEHYMGCPNAQQAECW